MSRAGAGSGARAGGGSEDSGALGLRGSPQPDCASTLDAANRPSETATDKAMVVRFDIVLA